MHIVSNLIIFSIIFNNISTILNVTSFEINKKFQDLDLKLIYFPKNLFR